MRSIDPVAGHGRDSGPIVNAKVGDVAGYLAAA
jgi:hypothetical protein